MRLDLIAGPNGAGKTTFAQHYLLPRLPPGTPFVNADVIASANWPADPTGHAADAALQAEETRTALIEYRAAFATETVFSHPAKLDLVAEAKAAGYTVALHVLLVTVDLAVARVDERVAEGGHPVPEDRIRSRFGRLWDLVAQAVDLADTTVFYDNTKHARPREVARFAQGIPVGPLEWPPWTPADLTDHWPTTA